MKKILLAQDTIDQHDINSLIQWLQTYPRLTKGEKTIEFEEKYAQTIGSRYAVFVNSGSSANLLMLYSLLSAKRLKNNKVVVPALCWITDISPAIQFGMEPILCDVNLFNLSVNVSHLEDIFKKEKPAALILVSALGLVPVMDDIADLCKKHDVILLVDNCEGLGSEYKGKHLENYGLMASCSTYFGHIISTIEGGIISTDDKDLYDTIKMLRSHGWDRDLDMEKKTELRQKYNISGFNSLYTFYTTGFNLRSTDLNAFLGLRQLDKLADVIAKRNQNYLLYKKHISNKLWQPNDGPDDFVSNLGYPCLHEKRDAIVQKLQENNVEVRPLISGSMGKQPFFIEKYGKPVEFYATTMIDNHGFYVPNHPFLTEADIKFVCDIINS